jgi:hypothetical protein
MWRQLAAGWNKYEYVGREHGGSVWLHHEDDRIDADITPMQEWRACVSVSYPGTPSRGFIELRSHRVVIPCLRHPPAWKWRKPKPGEKWPPDPVPCEHCSGRFASLEEAKRAVETWKRTG